MGLLDETRTIERQTFFNGQRLFAEDLQDILAFNREMGWMHNCSLHQPGIGNGYAVTGQVGDRTVSVGAGYALNIRGQEIINLETQQLDVPPVASEPDGKPVFYDLVVSYPDDSALPVVETRDGVCAPRGAVRLREQPVFCWARLVRTQPAGTPAPGANTNPGSQLQDSLVVVDPGLRKDIQDGMRIVLARIEVLNCQLNKEVSLAERRSARPALVPYLAAGSADAADWQAFFISMGKGNQDTPALIQQWMKEALDFLARIPVAEDAEIQPEDKLSLLDTWIGQFLKELLIGLGRRDLTRLMAFLTGLGPVMLPLGVEQQVSTAAACFQTTPHYMARIDGGRLQVISLIELFEHLGLLDMDKLKKQAPEVYRFLVDNQEWLQMVVYFEGLLNVSAAQTDSFHVQAALMAQLLNFPKFRLIQWLFKAGPLFRHFREQFSEIDPVARIEQTLLWIVGQMDWDLIWVGVEG